MKRVPNAMPRKPARIDQPSDSPSPEPTKPMGIVKYWKLPRNHSIAYCQFLPCRSGSGIQSIECTSIWLSSAPSISSIGASVRAPVVMSPPGKRDGRNVPDEANPDCDGKFHRCQHLFPNVFWYPMKCSDGSAA